MRLRLYKIIYLISFIIIYFAMFIKYEFNNISFELLLYNITNTKGANYDIVLHGFIFVFFFVAISFICLFILNRFILFFNKYKKVIAYVFLIFSIIFVLYDLGVFKFFVDRLSYSNLFENAYVDPRNVTIDFPDDKKNLIYIYVESLESSNVSSLNGGLVSDSYVPNLERLALDNINFSNNEKIGGALEVFDTEWTKAALVSHTAGVPLKFSFDKTNIMNLPGVFSIGDVLKDSGYNNYFMIGSDANFGGRGEYFKTHGDYTIYDYNYAIDDGFINSDYYVWWGYEDLKLFEYAKEKILLAAKEDKPFNFTMLTVDTHFTDGYMDSSCSYVFDSKYANSFYCSDSKIFEFIEWLKLQDFYDDTVIIITGDHLTMQRNFYDYDNDYTRTIYNTFINSSVLPENEKNRMFSTFDMYPTTLAALGAKIEGNRLGLGTNLFSDEKTLIEKYGYDYIQKEITMNSKYYEKYILNNK